MPSAGQEVLQRSSSLTLRTPLQLHQLLSSTETVSADSSSFQSLVLSVLATPTTVCFRSWALSFGSTIVVAPTDGLVRLLQFRRPPNYSLVRPIDHAHLSYICRVWNRHSCISKHRRSMQRLSQMLVFHRNMYMRISRSWITCCNSRKSSSWWAKQLVHKIYRSLPC